MNLHLRKTLPNVEPPWPWRVVELGRPVAPVFYIMDCYHQEVARFFGRNAKERCEFFMELRARKEIKQPKEKYESTSNYH